ncbi:MAG: hypothetical protein ACTHNW_01570 [Mucilaginibacter sp.]
MKELKQDSIIQTHYPITRYKPKKQWVRAQARPDKGQVMENNCTEAAYHRVIALVKSLMQPGEVYYERDHKTDHTEGLYGMHSFVTDSFSWSLYCEFSNNYTITYSYGDCPYRAAIEQALRAYPLDRVCNEQLRPDYILFYQSVLQLQPAKFIYTL